MAAGTAVSDRQRAIFDCGNRMLHFVGEGPVSIELPPGSESFPLESAPTGHLEIILNI